MTSRGKSCGCMGGLPINNRDLMGFIQWDFMGFNRDNVSWDISG